LAKIILKNSAKIDLEEKYIEEFCSFANLPKGKIFLVLHGNSLPESNQGVCVSSQLIKFAPELLGICPCSNLTTWDCCIAIAKKWCICRDVFPAYFTYLLGHEFGHAYVCLSDIALHIHCCLIRDWIRPASKNVIQLPHSLPNEQLFDRFGKYLSFKMHGDEKLDLEINALKETAGDIEKQHLEMIQELSTSGNGSNSLASLISDYDELFEY
jgi:hypothetical protein